MAHIVVAYVVMAYAYSYGLPLLTHIVMAHIAMTYVVMAYAYSYGLCRC